MRIILLFLLVASALLAESHDSKNNGRAKRDLLERSKRRWVLSTIELEEEMDVKYPHKISTMFNDKTEGKPHAFKITGEGVDEGLFTINETSGDVFVHQRIDREKKKIYHIKFDVYDKDTGAKIDKELAFDVEIKDINDNPPRFIRAPKQSKVKENTEEGYLDVQLEATDIDKENSPNSTFTISVVSQTPEEPKISFDQIDQRMGRLKFKGCFDYSKANKYKITVQAKDHGKPSLSSTTVVSLNVIDTNNHQPMFKKPQNQAEIEAMEMTVKDNLVRVSVEDKDSPQSDGWRAEYFFISGNDDQVFKIQTDPATNDGVLSIVKKKNYEITTLVNLQIGVKNVESLCQCKDGKLICDASALPSPDSMNITVRMIDSNDPPTFDKDIIDVYQKEESEEGQDLFTPKVHDIDSPNFRFELTDDPAGWVTIDEKTGKITSIKRMDRESPFVDDDNIYKVIISAIDDGEPPATSTCSIKIHLKDINDNMPKLINTSIIMCGNNGDKVMVEATDADADPYRGPFAFSLEDDENLKQRWKLEPSFGQQAGLATLVSLPYGNYSVPLVIQDQQNVIGRETLHVVLCDCEDGSVCRGKKPLSSAIGNAGIGLIIAGLLLFLILLLVFFCGIEKQKFIYIDKDEGHQTLIKYNEEGGGVACASEPTPLTPTEGKTVVDGFKKIYTQVPDMSQVTTYDMEMFNTQSNMMTQMNTMGLQRQRSSHRSQGDYSTYASRMHSYMSESHSQFSSYLQLEQRLASLIEQRQIVIDGRLGEQTEYQPTNYAFEGKGSICQSLDQLSVGTLEDGQFLDDLGPRFKTLAEICNQSIQAKNV